MLIDVCSLTLYSLNPMKLQWIRVFEGLVFDFNRTLKLIKIIWMIV